MADVEIPTKGKVTVEIVVHRADGTEEVYVSEGEVTEWPTS